MEGHIEQGSLYDQPGCYHIADPGKKGSTRTPARTPDEWRASVAEAMHAGKSLADALSKATGQVHDLFCGYYFIAGDGTVCGLCTGMQVRLL